jgi:hypothetical protein
VAASELPAEARAIVNELTEGGVAIVPAADVDDIAEQAGLSADEGDELQRVYSESQIASLRTAFFALIVIALASLLFSRGIPAERPARRSEPADAQPV